MTSWNKIARYVPHLLNTVALMQVKRVADIQIKSLVAYQQQPATGEQNLNIFNNSAGKIRKTQLANASTNTRGSYAATPVYATQTSLAAIELRVLSQPRNGISIDDYPNYVYPEQIQTTYICHVETGISKAHEDFQGREVEWLYPPGATEVEEEAYTRQIWP